MPLYGLLWFSVGPISAPVVKGGVPPPNSTLMYGRGNHKIVIRQVPRAPHGLIRIQNTEQGTLNRMVMTPRPRDPYLYLLCPPEILQKKKNKIFRIFGGHVPPSGGMSPP